MAAISMVTCYDYTSAKILDAAGIDYVLVGDSLGMTMLGYDSTLRVTMADMISHSAAVSRGIKSAKIIVDMPFMSYHTSTDEAVHNAGRLMQEGFADMVKLEGGVEFAPVIKAIVRASIPVCAHIGLTPQSVKAFGGFKVQGKDIESAEKIIADALAVQEAGATMVVLEGIPTRLAKIITDLLTIPTIGIGAGNVTDGQVLVWQDLLGLNTDFRPKFVKQYLNAAELIDGALKLYADEINTRSFPSDEYAFSINDEIIATLEKKYVNDL
ncbi:MAG: 3-methyl-2-oxobutanoate hydroxymethyltransferase [Lactobacillales bacterium]|jgi:3-methyl-2-oxobutanoate hydroxymethyltransferase|nr:3-methyl-2-oxobutanoate hydroxymethyltransferase [Lactobacillales bacterium]